MTPALGLTPTADALLIYFITSARFFSPTSSASLRAPARVSLLVTNKQQQTKNKPRFTRTHSVRSASVHYLPSEMLGTI